jgi:hypothetical protein|tara:strand:- start:425 stop:691 length:267 start_codon:yes stop_codon:yes gene_type:complete
VGSNPTEPTILKEKTMLKITILILGEILFVTNTTAEVHLTISSPSEIQNVKKTLELEDFPCTAYPGMLFYYVQNDKKYEIRCGEPEPN